MSQFLAASKIGGSVFIFGTVFDINSDMTSISKTFDPEHPLLADRERINRITDIMYAKIQKTLFPDNLGSRRRVETEQVLEGTAVSADDVLSDALVGLLSYPPERLEGTWEGLAVGIAHNKAVDALRAAEKGLRGTKHRDQLHLVSGDHQSYNAEGELNPSLFESIPSNWGDAEAEYFVMQNALKVRDLAREILDDRDRKVFFAIHFEGDSREEVGKRLDLTSQRIGQIYNAALGMLEAHPDYPFKPPIGVERLATRRNR